jgi:preprotein translocase subunit SecF
LGYPQAVDVIDVRKTLEDAGYKDVVVQHFGTAHDVLIRLAPKEDVSSAELSNEVINSLKKESGDIQIRRVDFVGPQVGDELTEDGGLAVLYALICIFIYVFFRFEWRFAIGSVAALFHDVLITLGVFSILQMDFDLTVLAACLAVIGYSLNDTIVVFDRIRENFRKMRKDTTIQIMNVSLNQTLSRTLMTSFTTLLVLIALILLGGELIRGFAAALIIGIVVGTYSSIYVASTSALMLGVSKADLMPVKKEGAEGEEIETP